MKNATQTRTIAFHSEDKTVALIHLLLGLITPLLILTLTGCKSNDRGEPVDYGPEAQGIDINEALYKPLESVDPLAMKVGAYAQFTTTQQLAGGQVVNRISDTGLKVVERNEDDASVIFRVRQDKAVYGNGAKPEVTSTDFTFGFSKDLTSNSTAQSALVVAPLELLEQGVPKILSKFDVASAARTSVRPFADRVTYHRLVTSVSDELPPSEVQAQPNCLGIPNCRIKVHRIEFDQVAWTGDQADRVHFDLAMSPDVPMIVGLDMSPLFEYYPGLMKSCVTLMASVGG